MHTREAPGGARDLFGEDAAHCGQDVGLQCGEAAELEGQGHHPLADGDIGEDAVGDGRRLVAHATCPATRAESALLTRKGHEDVMPARVASAADEALRKVAAEEVALEGVGHVARQGGAVGRAGEGDEGLVVLADELMEDGVVRPPRRIRGAEARQGPGAAARRVPARGRWISAVRSMPRGGAAMAEGGGRQARRDAHKVSSGPMKRFIGADEAVLGGYATIGGTGETCRRASLASRHESTRHRWSVPDLCRKAGA